MYKDAYAVINLKRLSDAGRISRRNELVRRRRANSSTPAAGRPAGEPSPRRRRLHSGHQHRASSAGSLPAASFPAPREAARRKAAPRGLPPAPPAARNEVTGRRQATRAPEDRGRPRRAAEPPSRRRPRHFEEGGERRKPGASPRRRDRDAAPRRASPPGAVGAARCRYRAPLSPAGPPRGGRVTCRLGPLAGRTPAPRRVPGRHLVRV